MLQDPVVGFNMVSDLEERVNRAVAIAEKTKSTSKAIDMASELAEKETQREAADRLREIRACEACQRAKNQVGYPGMPSSYRYCEAHR